VTGLLIYLTCTHFTDGWDLKLCLVFWFLSFIVRRLWEGVGRVFCRDLSGIYLFGCMFDVCTVLNLGRMLVFFFFFFFFFFEK
jgi:hypothetical protein